MSLFTTDVLGIFQLLIFRRVSMSSKKASSFCNDTISANDHWCLGRTAIGSICQESDWFIVSGGMFIISNGDRLLMTMVTSGLTGGSSSNTHLPNS